MGLRYEGGGLGVSGGGGGGVSTHCSEELAWPRGRRFATYYTAL